MEELGRLRRFNGVVQVELFPWHSPTFNAGLLPLLQQCDLTTFYLAALRDYLSDKHVITIDRPPD